MISPKISPSLFSLSGSTFCVSPVVPLQAPLRITTLVDRLSPLQRTLTTTSQVRRYRTIMSSTGRKTIQKIQTFWTAAAPTAFCRDKQSTFMYRSV